MLAQQADTAIRVLTRCAESLLLDHSVWLGSSGCSSWKEHLLPLLSFPHEGVKMPVSRIHMNSFAYLWIKHVLVVVDQDVGVVDDVPRQEIGAPSLFPPKVLQVFDAVDARRHHGVTVSIHMTKQCSEPHEIALVALYTRIITWHVRSVRHL